MVGPGQRAGSPAAQVPAAATGRRCGARPRDWRPGRVIGVCIGFAPSLGARDARPGFDGASSSWTVPIRCTSRSGLAGVDQGLAGVDQGLAGVDQGLAGVDQGRSGSARAPGPEPDPLPMPERTTSP